MFPNVLQSCTWIYIYGMENFTLAREIQAPSLYTLLEKIENLGLPRIAKYAIFYRKLNPAIGKISTL